MTALRNARIILDADELLYAVAIGEVEITTADDVITAMSRVGRNPAPRVLLELFDLGEVDYAWMPQLVPDAWSGAEWPLQMLPRADWHRLWDACGGFVVDGVRAPRRRPRKPRRLYRGADADHRDGWSWTPDPAVAGWFADREIHRRRGRVWTALVPPAAMLAVITDQRPGEPEVVVDTAGLEIVPAEDVAS
jgi:hypothetical protein